MSGFSRRRMLQLGSMAAATAALAACGGGDSGGTATGSSLKWWDQLLALQKMHAQRAEAFTKSSGVKTEYTYFADGGKLSEALALANQSKQLPDIFANVLGLPLAALIAENWVGPLAVPQASLDRLPKGSFAEGSNMLDGKYYGIPIFSSRSHATGLWFNKNLAPQADIDPEAPPKTYEEFRAACGKLKALGKEFFPMALGLGDPARMRVQADDLAQAAGFPGWQGLHYRTGQYAYHDDAYVTVLEFLKSLSDDGYIVPGANTLQVGNMRLRWASGGAVFFPDGPWCAGGLKINQPAALEQLEVGPILRPEGEAFNYRVAGSASPTMLLSKSTTQSEAANKLLETFTAPDYLTALAGCMDQPPIDLDAVDNADVIEPYRRLVGFYKESVKFAPDLIGRTPGISEVQAAAKPISPDLGSIVQGYLGGDITDVKAALKKLSDDFEKNREEGIARAKGKGVTISVDDYMFSDWKPGQDYVAA